MKLRNICASLLIGISLCASAKNDAPKYIFYFIGDGMGVGQVMGADTYRRLVDKADTTLLMKTFPVASLCTTYSASSPVTDSAAAGTALATGSKTRNNMLGMNADSIPVSSIADDFHAAGYGIGLVTNVCPDDATPGAFYAHVPNRGMYYEIGVQAAESPVSFLAGSRMRGAFTKGKYNGLYEKFEKEGMAVVRGAENLKGVHSPRILLLSTDTVNNNSGYAIDAPNVNLLYDFTDAAIEHLMKHTPKKFFLMVEGGNIDWAGHDNDASAIVKEVIAYDKTLRLAYDFYLQHPKETLIVVTADHETGGMSVGQKSVGYNCYPGITDYQKVSKAEFGKMCEEFIEKKEVPDRAWMKTFLKDSLGFYEVIKVDEKRQKDLDDSFDRTFVTYTGHNNDGLYHRFPEFVETVYKYVNGTSGFGFTTGNHSGNPVPVFAIGKGAEQFGRPLDNTDIPKTFRKLLGK